MAYVTILPGAFNDDSVIGRTVKVEEIEIEDGQVISFSFTWAENPYDMETVSPQYCRTATREEVSQAERDYANEGARFA